MIYIVIILSVIIFEIFVKTFIDKNNIYGRYFLKKHIYIENLNNYGVFGGFLKNYSKKLKTILSFFLIAFSGIYLLFIAFNNRISRITKVSFALLLGGGWSNLFDRYRFGYVKDYFSIRFDKLKQLSRFVFNLADIFIFIGGALYIIRRIVKGKA